LNKDEQEKQVIIKIIIALNQSRTRLLRQSTSLSSSASVSASSSSSSVSSVTVAVVSSSNLANGANHKRKDTSPPSTVLTATVAPSQPQLVAHTQSQIQVQQQLQTLPLSASASISVAPRSIANNAPQRQQQSQLQQQPVLNTQVPEDELGSASGRKRRRQDQLQNQTEVVSLYLLAQLAGQPSQPSLVFNMHRTQAAPTPLSFSIPASSSSSSLQLGRQELNPDSANSIATVAQSNEGPVINRYADDSLSDGNDQSVSGDGWQPNLFSLDSREGSASAPDPSSISFLTCGSVDDDQLAGLGF
jgi:hypothetical protein